MDSILSFNEQFSADDDCRRYLEEVRWGKRPQCPHCKKRKAYDLEHATARPGLYKCAQCRQEFTVTIGTVFEDSHVPLPKWFLAIYLIVNAKKGISTSSLSRLLGLTYKTTWFLTHRIRHMMELAPSRRMRGIVEADETYIGGKPRGGKRGRGSESKTPVLALVQRGGAVRTKVVESVNAETLKTAIRENVAPSTVMMTDEWSGYLGLDLLRNWPHSSRAHDLVVRVESRPQYLGLKRAVANCATVLLKKDYKSHRRVNHGRGEYARRGAHVNTAESFFALLKRGMYGTFHHVSKKHLHRYANEFGFRWTFKDEGTIEQFNRLLGQAVGRRLAYRQPTSRISKFLVQGEGA